MTSDIASAIPPRWRVAIGLGIAAVTFLSVRALTQADAGALSEPPSEIVGRWMTEDPRYAHRAFVIDDEAFHLEVGEDSILSYRLAAVRRFDMPDFHRYVLTYHTREGEAEQEFRLFPDGDLRLKNPPDVVWTRR